jgi:hypothetical protein
VVENTKAREITLLKELGKIASYLRKKRYPVSVKVVRLEHERVAVKCPRRLFTKNTGLCEVVRRRIGADACPVSEGYGERLGVYSDAVSLSPDERRP